MLASTSSELRRAGAITLVLGAAWFVVAMAVMIAQRLWQFLPNEATFAVLVLGLPSVVIWCVGMHRFLWGQIRDAARMNRIAMTAASVVAGCCTFALLQVAVGVILALVAAASGHGRP